MKDFMATLAGVLLGSLLFVLIMGGPQNSASLKSETGNVMKSMVIQMNSEVKP